MHRIFAILSNFSLYLGKWFGVPVTLHWSWVLLFLFILATNPSMAASYAGLFFIVLLHELGHCLAGHYYRLHVRDIVLYPFGGAAAIQMPAEPHKELVVSLAGPFVNVLLIPVLWFIGSYHQILNMLFIYNFVILVFNMIPAFPMDGGRVLRATLSMLTGNHLKSTVIAGRIGQAFCVAFALLGLVTLNLMLCIIGAFIYLAAEAEIIQTRKRAEQNGLPVPPNNDGIPPEVGESHNMIVGVQERLARLDQRRDEV